jgi:hypothetical protein
MILMVLDSPGTYYRKDWELPCRQLHLKEETKRF